jgi:hypothetical protein
MSVKNARCTRNEHTRQQITAIIAGSEPDAIIKTSDITTILSKRYRGVNHHNVGNLLRERDDVVWVTNGTWRVKG